MKKTKFFLLTKPSPSSKLFLCERVCGCVCARAFVFSLCGQNHFLACAGFFGLAVLPRQMFPHRLTGKLCLTGVAEVPRQVERLT